MRITILTAGSLGDVRPYVALGCGLQAAGHEVRVASYHFEELVRGRGLDFFRFRGELGGGPERDRWRLSGGRPLAFVYTLTRGAGYVRALVRLNLDNAWEACQGADVVIGGFGAVGVPTIAAALDVPFFWALLQPMTPTRAFPHFLARPGLRLGALYNELSYWVANRILWRLVRGAIAEWQRERFGLAPPARASHLLPGAASHPVLYGFSPAVIAPPADWGPHAHVTGYWFLPREHGWEPDRELDAFLDGGPPPVWVALGDGRTSRARLPTVLAALERTNLRALLYARGVGEPRLPPTVRRVDFQPLHDYLLPRVAAACHHFGAGTAAAAAFAGIPSLGWASTFDQRFWGWRLSASGAALPPLPQQPSVERLAAAFERAVGDGELRRVTAELGARVRREDGVAAAVAALHAYLAPATAGVPAMRDVA